MSYILDMLRHMAFGGRRAHAHGRAACPPPVFSLLKNGYFAVSHMGVGISLTLTHPITHPALKFLRLEFVSLQNMASLEDFSRYS